MVIYKNEQKVADRENVRGGKGTATFTYHSPNETLGPARLIATIEIPPGMSIGEHAHEGETEYYIIQTGAALVTDNGVEKKMRKGDVMITGNGSSHSIANIGAGTLVFTAIILKN